MDSDNDEFQEAKDDELDQLEKEGFDDIDLSGEEDNKEKVIYFLTE